MDFNIIRCDRTSVNSQKKDGCDVCIAINKKFKFTVIPISENLVELIIVEVNAGNSSIILGARLLAFQEIII